MAKHPTKKECESALRTAAAFGQIEVIKQILGDPSTDLQAADEETGFTALHCAAMNDHVNVVKLLISHGAQLNKVDCEGRQATHHAIAGVGVRCLEYFWETFSIDTTLDDQGLSVWHWAAINQTKQALETLARYSTPMPSLSGIRTKAGWSPLLSAASVGSAENIEWLLRAGCKITDKAHDGSTALHLASHSGVSGAVQILLKDGSEVSAITDDGSTALHFALLDLKEETTVVLQPLLKQGLDASQAREDGVLPIHLLISQCANISTWRYFPRSDWLLDTFRVLVSRTDLGTENPTGKSTVQLLADVWQKFCLGRSGLEESHAAVKATTTVTKMMHMAMDRLRLTKNSQSWCIDPCYLVTALTIPNEELAYKILTHLPDADAVTGNSSVIEAACLSGCSSTMLKELLLRSKVPSENNQVKGLVRSVCEADLIDNRHEVVKVLLEAGFNPNDSCPSSGQSPLMIAACHGNTDLMEVLLSNGANIDAHDKHGNNVAHFACLGSYLKAVQILRATAVNWNKQGIITIDSVEFVGISPLHIAASHGESHLLEFLIDENLVTDIDIATPPISGTALHIAAWQSRPLNVSSLLSRNANATIKTGRSPQTPLHLASRLGHEAVVRVFLDYNCDINVLDSGGLDCETLAKKYDHRGVEMILREYRETQGEICRLLCWILAKYFCSLGKQSPTAPRSVRDSQRASAMLQVAIEKVDIELCKRLAYEGTSLSTCFDECDGCTPLLYLLQQSPFRNDQIEMTEFLILQGASIEGAAGHRWSRDWYTVWHFITEFGYTRLLQILLHKYPSSLFELETIIHPLHLAVLNGNYQCVQLILHHCQTQPGTQVFRLAEKLR